LQAFDARNAQVDFAVKTDNFLAAGFATSVPKGLLQGIVTKRSFGLAGDTAFKPIHYTGKTP